MYNHWINMGGRLLSMNIKPLITGRPTRVFSGRSTRIIRTKYNKKGQDCVYCAKMNVLIKSCSRADNGMPLAPSRPHAGDLSLGRGPKAQGTHTDALISVFAKKNRKSTSVERICVWSPVSAGSSAIESNPLMVIGCGFCYRDRYGLFPDKMIDELWVPTAYYK